MQISFTYFWIPGCARLELEHTLVQTLLQRNFIPLLGVNPSAHIRGNRNMQLRFCSPFNRLWNVAALNVLSDRCTCLQLAGQSAICKHNRGEELGSTEKQLWLSGQSGTLNRDSECQVRRPNQSTVQPPSKLISKSLWFWVWFYYVVWQSNW